MQLPTYLLAALAVASSVQADTLTDALRLRLNQNLEVAQELQVEAPQLDCSNIQKMMCPNTKQAPNVKFSDLLGSVTGSTNACCKRNYLQCQLQLGTNVCREIATYTIPSVQGNSEDTCPPTTPECTCQQALASVPKVTVQLCPSKTECCPTCECQGDPHCSSFDLAKPSVMWAVCDDRDATCVHKSSTCANTTYDGQTCQWINHGGGFGECVRAANTKEPGMIMYEKKYRPAFGSSNDLQVFRLTLGLTTYGSINKVTIEDGNTLNVFAINSKGQCTGTPRFPVSNNHVSIYGLPSGVSMELQCMSTGTGRPMRFDVNHVKDPWYAPNTVSTIAGEQYAGFCATGVIAENGDKTNTACRIMDRQVANYYGCKANTPMTTCKAQFCTKEANKFTFQGLAGTPQQQCSQYVNDPNGASNLVYAACAVAKMYNAGSSVNPAECVANRECKKCVNDVTDFPEQIGTILKTRAAAPTKAPTQRCPPNLANVGLARKTLSVFQSGVQVEFNKDGVWTGVFALLDEEVESCGGCKNVLTIDEANQGGSALLVPGTYRIKQCTGLNTDSAQPLCDSALGYNATIMYKNPYSGGAVSATYGDLYNAGALVCSPAMFKKCPLNYQCCIWDKKAQRGAWDTCMTAFHPDYVTAYPEC